MEKLYLSEILSAIVLEAWLVKNGAGMHTYLYTFIKFNCLIVHY